MTTKATTKKIKEETVFDLAYKELAPKIRTLRRNFTIVKGKLTYTGPVVKTKRDPSSRKNR